MSFIWINHGMKYIDQESNVVANSNNREDKGTEKISLQRRQIKATEANDKK